MSSTSSPPRPHVGLIVLLAFVVAISGLVTVITPGTWLLLLVGIASAVLVSGMLARAVGLPRAVTAIIPLLVAMVVTVARFAPDTAILGVLPTPATAERLVELYRDGFVALAWQSPPAAVTEPVAFLLGIGLAAAAVVADALVFTLRRPALVGIPLLLVLLAPSIPPDSRASALAFIGVASAYLWLLLDGRGAHPRLQVPRVLGIGAVAMAAALVVPGFLPATERDTAAGGVEGSLATGVNPLLNLGEDLRRGDERVVVTYSTGSGDPYYLRLTEIRDFSGQSWAPDQPVLRPQHRPTAIPLLRENRDVPFEREIGVFVIGNLVSPWLPVPYPTTSIHELVGDWQYVPESYTVASNTSTAAGESYTARSNRLQPTPEQLRSAGRTVPDGLEAYLELQDVPDIVAETARAVTASAGTNYERALALQSHLRSAPYRYSERAPITGGFDHTGMDALAAFLDVKAGYCIHFASAMATMARVLGIPARIIVGFQPGERESGVNGAPDLFTVTSQDLHAWPELYFDGVGWIGFEPTPTRGSVPEYARVGASGVPSVGIPRDGGAQPDVPELSDDSVTGARTVGVAVDARGMAIAGAATLLAVVVTLLPLSVRTVRRRRVLDGLRHGTADARDAWRELLATVRDTGVALSDTLTPREAIGRLLRLHDMSGDGREALARLGTAIERAGYGRPDVTGRPRPDVAADLEAATGALFDRLDTRERLRARLLPPSLLRRAPHPVASPA